MATLLSHAIRVTFMSRAPTALNAGYLKIILNGALNLKTIQQATTILLGWVRGNAWEVSENFALRLAFPLSKSCIDRFLVELAWREMRLFVAKVLWSFDVEMVSDQKIVYERDFKMHGMWEKPEFWVRFHPVDRSD